MTPLWDTELCATNLLVSGGHGEVIRLNEFCQRKMFVTETELGQLDGITPQAAL